MGVSTGFRRVIGLMSGTSLDGVDAAGLVTDGVTVAAFGPTLTVSYEAALRRDLRDLLDLAPTLPQPPPASTGGDSPAPPPALAGGGRGEGHLLIDVTRRLTDAHAEAVAALAWPADLIGFHGQTILHQPDRRRTWQIGDAQRLADRTGLPVVHDFRGADVAAGGQGAPLVPLFHAALAETLEKPLAVLNLGGVANVTWIGPDGAFLAMDTGPGNALLDDWAAARTGAALDHDGRLALGGRVAPEVLACLLAAPFFARAAPKSLDRLDFSAALATSGLASLSAADGAATLVAFTAQAVAAAALPSPPRQWLVGGGGRKNPAIMAALAQALAPAPVRAVETVGWDGDALEAQCFAYLAVRSVARLPLSLPGTTGVPAPTPGGVLSRPRAPSRGG